MGTADVSSELEARVAAGQRLDEAALREIAALDVLTLGMLADQARKRVRGVEATFVRVFESDVATGWHVPAVPAAASEIRVRGLGATLADTVAAVRLAREAAGDRMLSGFSLAEIAEQGRQGWGELDDVLRGLREAGLDAVADVPIDRLDLDGGWIEAARKAGVSLPRLTVDRVLGPDRVAVLLAVRRLQDAGAGLRAIAPLPRTASSGADPARAMAAAPPTTGYDDVRAVALARLVLDNVPSIQVDWQQYGPKLAQVALTFGADDIDGVAAEDDPAQGWRRAPAEEVRRNIAAAGLTAVERDGRFVMVSGERRAGGESA
jgi:hypothetical protein